MAAESTPSRMPCEPSSPVAGNIVSPIRFPPPTVRIPDGCVWELAPDRPRGVPGSETALPADVADQFRRQGIDPDRPLTFLEPEQVRPPA